MTGEAITGSLLNSDRVTVPQAAHNCLGTTVWFGVRLHEASSASMQRNYTAISPLIDPYPLAASGQSESAYAYNYKSFSGIGVTCQNITVGNEACEVSTLFGFF